jgi:GNAT superfamily N-acetyltransferase
MRSPAIRRATAADAERLAAVYRSAYEENRRLGFPAKAGSATPDTVAGWIGEHRVHVAGVGGTVVGGVRLDPTGPGRVTPGRLGVHEDWKGEGVGSALVAHAEEWAHREGYAVVRLTTPEDHPYLPGFYRRRGYERTGEYPLEYRDYDEVVVEKRLR